MDGHIVPALALVLLWPDLMESWYTMESISYVQGSMLMMEIKSKAVVLLRTRQLHIRD